MPKLQIQAGRVSTKSAAALLMIPILVIVFRLATANFIIRARHFKKDI
jgi:hypothetical protein